METSMATWIRRYGGRSQVTGREEPPPLWVMSLRDLDDPALPDVEWVVDGLLPLGAVGLLLGRPKVGKSLLALDLAASVAKGERFLGRATRQGPVLYVAAEDAPAVLRSRLRSRLGDDRELPLEVVTAHGAFGPPLRIDQPESVVQLARKIAEMGARVVVLDPLRELHLRDENDSKRMVEVMQPLRTIARVFNALVLLTHHRGKRGTVPSIASRGSSAISGAVDVVLSLEAPGKAEAGEEEEEGAARATEGALVLRVEGRYGPRQRLGVRLGPKLRWKATGPGGGSGGSSGSGGSVREEVPVRERVRRQLVGATEPLTAGQVRRACGGSRSNVQEALRGLVAAGELVREGVGTAGDPFRYRRAEAE